MFRSGLNWVDYDKKNHNDYFHRKQHKNIEVPTYRSLISHIRNYIIL